MSNPDPVTQFIADARDCVTRANSWPGVPDPVSLRDSWARACVDRLARALDMIEADLAELRSIRADAGALDNYGPFDKGLDHACHRIEAALRKVVEEQA